MTVKAFDRRDTGENVGKLGFLLRTHILSQPHEMDRWMICTKLKLPLDSPDSKQFTFGLTSKKLSKRVDAITSAINNVKNALFGLIGHHQAGGTEPGEGGVKVTETFILDHVGELAFTLLGAAVGFLWKKLMDMVKEQKYLHDGVLAMLHDRLYLICTHYIKMGYIDTDGLDNVGVIYRAYHGLKGNGTGTNLYKRICALPIKEGDEPRPELP